MRVPHHMQRGGALLVWASMFDSLSQRLGKAWDSVRKDGKLTADNIKTPLREIRRALLEADVRSSAHPCALTLQHMHDRAPRAPLCERACLPCRQGCTCVRASTAVAAACTMHGLPVQLLPLRVPCAAPDSATGGMQGSWDPQNIGTVWHAPSKRAGRPVFDRVLRVFRARRAQVSLPIVRQFVASVERDALGVAVLKGVRPDQQLVKVVNDQLIQLMGGQQEDLVDPKDGPQVGVLHAACLGSQVGCCTPLVQRGPGRPQGRAAGGCRMLLV